MTHFAILLDGPCEPTRALTEAVQNARAVAADGGMRHAALLDLTPELWVGDFDGAPSPLLAAHADVPRDRHPTAKDATDGEIAVRAALERGATQLTLLGAFGGARIDHALGTLALGLAVAADGLGVAADGVAVAMTDGRQWALPLLPGRPQRVDAPGRTVSVIGLDDMTGLTLTGVRWPLTRAHVPFGASLTLSNEALSNEALPDESSPHGTGPVEASLEAGRAWLVHGPGDGG